MLLKNLDFLWNKLKNFFLEHKRNFLLAVIFWLIAGVTYFISPHLIFLEPTEMPYTTIDKMIPFWPFAILIYGSLYFEIFFMFLVIRERKILWYFFSTYMIAGAILTAFYIFLPTIHKIPSPVGESANFLEYLVVLLRNIDISANQLPSGHAFYSMTGAFFLLELGNKKLGWFFFFWGFAICLSALLVKQHSIVDVGVGILFASVLGNRRGNKAFWSMKRFG